MKQTQNQMKNLKSQCQFNSITMPQTVIKQQLFFNTFHSSRDVWVTEFIFIVYLK